MRSTLLLTFALCVGAAIRDILHLSDIHADLQYRAGAPDTCVIGTRLGTGCCRALDIPRPGSRACSPWGAPNTDVPLKLVNATLRWIAATVQPWAVFQTGDDCSHHDVTQTVEQNLETIGTIQRMIAATFPGVPVFNSLGNHDTYPIDQTPPVIYPRMLRRIADLWFPTNATIPDSGVVSDHGRRWYGYYTMPLHPGVDVVAINPIYYDAHNIFRVRDDARERGFAGDQFAWLDQQFRQATTAGRKVILLNHIPINGSESTRYFNDRLTAVLRRYADTLLLHLNGHEHSDHLYLYRDSFSLIPNSLVPSGNFPGFRVYRYDDVSRTFLDYRQYGCNLTRIIETDRFSCEALYGFRDLYGADNLSLASIRTAVRRIGTNVTLANQYLWFRNFGAPVPERCADLVCAQQVMGQIVVE